MLQEACYWIERRRGDKRLMTLSMRAITKLTRQGPAVLFCCDLFLCVTRLEGLYGEPAEPRVVPAHRAIPVNDDTMVTVVITLHGPCSRTPVCLVRLHKTCGTHVYTGTYIHDSEGLHTRFLRYAALAHDFLRATREEN